MKIREPWNTIHNFFAGYFHQDWKEDDPNVDAVVQRYMRDSTTQEIRDLIEDIEEYMRDHLDDADLLRLLFEDLGCFYLPTADGLTARQWMTHVVDLLRQEADRRPTA